MSIRASVPRSRISPKKIRRPPSLSEIPKSSYIKVVNVRFVSAMEYEKTYVFKPGERPSKRRRVEPKGLQSSWKLRQAAYQEAWREQQSKIDSTLENINSSTIHEISGFLDDNGERSDGGRIPAGIIITGPSAPHSSIAEQLAKHKASCKPERIFVSLSSGSGSNLKALLKTLIQRATSRGSALDDETDEVQTLQKKGAKLLNYDLQLLHDFVLDRKLRQVVVTFDDTEAFDSDLLSELVELLGYWQDRIPFVLLFSVATSVDFLQQRLSREAIKCLDGRLFDVAPSAEVLEQMIDTITSTDPPIYIGPTVMGMALERQSDYIQSIDSFVDALKYAYMSCFYANPLSLFTRQDLDIRKIPKDHFEALRCTDSFQDWARRSLDEQRTAEVKAALHNDLALLELVQQCLSEGQATLKGMMFAISVIRTLQQTLPNASVSPKSTLYVQAMTGKLPGSTMLRSLMLTRTQDLALAAGQGLHLSPPPLHRHPPGLLHPHPDQPERTPLPRNLPLRPPLPAPRSLHPASTPRDRARTSIAPRLPGLRLLRAGEGFTGRRGRRGDVSRYATCDGGALSIVPGAVMGDDADERQSMALFQRALAELRALGMVKSTRKRVDHIAKVAWRGL
ncbi:hypothetical protein KC323_g276 [Hortaea werneckii]|nr:hypothetical protein KC323_g276 [Hortaea werneckii]